MNAAPRSRSLLLEAVETMSDRQTGSVQENYPFLVHKTLIGAVIDDSFAKNWCREFAIDLLGVQIRMFPVEDEIVALAAEEYSCRFAEQHKGEAVSVFGLAVKEEPVRVHAVLYSATNQWEPVENDWWPT